MKLIKIISHPATLIICFLLVLISGQHLGGFYLLYILLGLPHGAVHSILGVMGVGILLFSHYKYKRAFIYMIEPLLNIAGVILLGLSLFLFFYNDRSQYNYSTFYETLPQISMVLFAFLIASFLVINLIKLRQVAT
ncbi:MAG: hypothetical protein H7Z13_02105 [Ferruginibacter sp.]|nr:hypothetical protein [Ferruginibacter sp.]